MTIKTLLLMLSCLCVGFFSMQFVHAESPVAIQNNSQLVTLDMQNMTCPLCKFTITKAIQGVDGVQEVNIDYDNKTTTVIFDPQKASIEAIIQATTNAGYPGTVHLPK